MNDFGGETKKIFFSGLQSYKPDRKGGPGSQLSRPVHKTGVLHKILSGDNYMYLEPKYIIARLVMDRYLHFAPDSMRRPF